MTSRKIRDLIIVLVIYLLAFFVGYLPTRLLGNFQMQIFVFDAVATVVVFIFSVLLHNSSVYDAYWSAAPMGISLWIFVTYKSFSIMQIVFLTVFLLWSLRLTINWITVFTDFSYEDWRYKKYRDETPRILWPLVNFFGIHFMPTLVVFAGMLPLFSIAKDGIGIMSIPGIVVMLFGICMEFFADRQMHAFLKSKKSGEVCDIGLWKYSRHPNYLGEISFWCGVYLVMLPYDVRHWYYAVGCLAVGILFNVVSIPLMEKRQLSRRMRYAEYKQRTSRLLLLPQKK